MTATVDPFRLRCRGDNHKPGCSHLGDNTIRVRCRKDKHRPGCNHLNPPKRGRPSLKADARSEGQLRRWAQIRADKGVIPESLCEPLGATETNQVTERYIDTTPESITRETPRLIRPYLALSGPVHVPGSDWRQTDCLCVCHFTPETCNDETCKRAGVTLNSEEVAEARQMGAWLRNEQLLAAKRAAANRAVVRYRKPERQAA